MLWWWLAWFPHFYSDFPWPYCGYFFQIFCITQKLHNCNYLANRLGGPTNFFSHAEQDKIFFDFIFKWTFSLWYLAIYWLEKVLSQCSHCIRFCWFSIKSSTALEVSNTPVLIVVKSVFFFFTTLLLVPSVFEVSRFSVLFKFTLFRKVTISYRYLFFVVC